MNIPESTRCLLRDIADERGASSAEYALLIGLIAVVIMAALTLFGTNLRSLFEAASEVLPT